MDTKQFESLSYRPENHNIMCKCTACAIEARAAEQGMVEMGFKQATSAPPATKGKNTPIIEPKTGHEKSKVVGQLLEYPEMCKNTKLIVNACKQVVQSADDYDSETMTTPITVVQACEQLNCVLEKLRNEAEKGMIEMGFKQSASVPHHQKKGDIE